LSDRLFNPREAHRLEDPERRLCMPPADVLAALNIRAGIRVADIGAGTGYFGIPIAQSVGPGGKVFAIDVQLEMLNEDVLAWESGSN
jgi:predicted methyltransferase